ncbi:MAG: zf-HC2 domain-containing protein [Gemmatimonadales bacterium]|nr:MAG: zf-HC2 domain-containing protein [Gemmatimonadales bacterium]
MMSETMNHQGSNDGSNVCGEILDIASRGAARGLSAPLRARVEAHTEHCRDCASDVRFMRKVHRARSAPPPGLARAVLARLEVESERIQGGWRSASLAAVAVLVLAMGMGLATQAVDSQPEAHGWELAVADGDLEWLADEWLVAGAPYLEGVSDETLLALLSEEDF